MPKCDFCKMEARRYFLTFKLCSRCYDLLRFDRDLEKIEGGELND